MFDTSLPVSELIPLNRISDPGNINLWCKVTNLKTYPESVE